MTLVADRPLTEADIKICAIIWYGGTTSTSGWDCPAEIIEVNHAERTFKVKSLDDMIEQKQVYNFDVDDHSPESRKSMIVPDPERVKRYLNVIIQRQLELVENVKTELRREKAKADRIQEYIFRYEGMKYNTPTN